MYPIQCPIIVAPASGLVRLGASYASVSQALNFFSNQATGLAVPMISEDWDRISSVALGSANPSDVLVWMRRLSDAGMERSHTFREVEAKVAREAENAANTKASQHSIDIHHVDRARLAELSVKSAQRRSDAFGGIKSRWHLAPIPKGQLFMNEDGRAIHLLSVTGAHAVLGYGWHTSVMHYLELTLKQESRSVGLFQVHDAHPSDLTFPWFSALVQSMVDFYSGTSFGAADPKIIINGTDMKKAAFQANGSWKDSTFLSRSFRSLSLSQDFTVETEDLVDGSRNPTFQSIRPRVPQGQFRYLSALGRVVSGFYRAENHPVPGESGLAHEIRHRLIFPKSSSSRPPTRP